MTAPVHTDVPGMLPGLFPYSLAVRLGDTVRTAGIALHAAAQARR